MGTRDVEYEGSGEYECLQCGEILTAGGHPGECPECGGGLRNRRTPFE